MSLKKLSPTTTRRLSSSRTISSVCDAVKELVENALDSGATSITIKLVNYGLERIEVQDNGSGVPVSSAENMCLPYYTSKIKDFSDIENKLQTYGFRGEALSSLCNVADVQITTRTENDNYATVFTYDKNGKVLDGHPSHFGKGTTVAVVNIFSNIPVRKKYISSSAKAQGEYKKTDSLLKNFAIINSDVYFSLIHNKSIKWTKSVAQTLKESAQSVLGYSLVNQLEEISSIHKKTSITLVIPNKHCKALAALCFAISDVIRIFINRRPVKYNKLQKITLKYISAFFGDSFPQGKYPSCIINIQMAPDDLDVNLEPNKMKVLCRDEDELLLAVEKLLNSYYKLPDVSCNEQSSLNTGENTGMKNHHTSQTHLQNTSQVKNNLKSTSASNKKSNSSRGDDVYIETILEKSIISVAEKEQLWKSADKAMGFWNERCTKSSSGDIERAHKDSKTSHLQDPEVNHLQSRKETQSTDIHLTENSTKNESERVQNITEDTQRKASSLISSKEDLWVLADPAIPISNKGQVQSSSAKMIEDEQMFSVSKNVELVNQHCAKRPRMSDPKANETAMSLFEHQLNENVNEVLKDTTIECNAEQNLQCEEMSMLLDISLSAPVNNNVVTHSHGNERRVLPFSINKDAPHSEKACSKTSYLQDTETNHLQSLRETKNHSINIRITENSTENGPESVLNITENNQSTSSLVPTNEDLWALADKAMSVWSKGQVLSSSGEIIEGGTALFQPKPRATNINEVLKRMPEDKCKVRSGKNKVRTSGLFNTSFHTVSSQLGCKEMFGFSKFYEEKRRQVLAENPGICFTKIASLVSDEWKKLSSEERAAFNAIADSSKHLRPHNKSLSDSTEATHNKSIQEMFGSSIKRKIDKTNVWKVSKRFWEVRRPKSNMELKCAADPEKIELLCLLQPEELWLCKRNQEIGIIKPRCLQEKVLYKQLEQSYTVPIVPLQKRLIIKREDLSSEMWLSLKNMETVKVNDHSYEIASPIIHKNGFRLLWEEDQLYLTHVASTIRHYGLEELCEVLLLMKCSSSLAECRPTKVSAYLENEAVRIVNQKHTVFNKEKMEELLNSWSKENECVHQRPIIKFVFTLPGDKGEMNVGDK